MTALSTPHSAWVPPMTTTMTAPISMTSAT